MESRELLQNGAQKTEISYKKLLFLYKKRQFSLLFCSLRNPILRHKLRYSARVRATAGIGREALPLPLHSYPYSRYLLAFCCSFSVFFGPSSMCNPCPPPPNFPLCVCAPSRGFLFFFTLLLACMHDTAAQVDCCCGSSQFT